MCTRFYVEPDTEEIQDVIRLLRESGLYKRLSAEGKNIVTGGEVFPSQIVPVIAPDRNGRTAVFPMKWGFTSFRNSLLVNARSETAAVKPSFREAWEKHRCVIPASWYFEWTHRTNEKGKTVAGDKFAVHSADDSVLYLCGLYRIEDGLPTFTVLTREAEGQLARLHDRMPVILPQGRTEEWIDPSGRPDEVLAFALRDFRTEPAV